ncbi:metallophosphoesterase family protein [Martelella mediterranea]|uniref:Calcineurin-like phosphoesterase superfamily domain protein n=1 Tax=Martelella mediterranea DSM 17316 TaxID=1122214 RepID=A0A1U9Z8D3_9HYPH|nr:metallophosphoesterase [Martelella mediterranea]AQZ53979.1 Calcineurin-like phosphoesterase superfamily domain protein [Martelella mediterranea DSM 17316]
MKLAVVADVHLHDLEGGYGWLEAGSGDVALRTLEDTMASTRVFNESHAAFRAVLDDIVGRKIRDVVLLGDYSDDGQPGAVAALKRILSAYETAHGLRFFATFGNHDCFGPVPRHQEKWLTKADGLAVRRVTSDPRAPAADAIVRGGMIGMSTPDAIAAMAQYGITRPDGVGHWETPFIDHDGARTRRCEDHDPEDTDASYLVEPQDGLWLLMLDANVFYRLDGLWQVRSNAAWDHVLAQRPYILDWIADVSERAQRMGKTLLAFSHYPALPLAMTVESGLPVAACTPDWLKRMPSLESSRALAEAGMRWHFSGHMHVAGRVEWDGLINIAVPSPVAYPGGYVVVTGDYENLDCEFVRLKEAPGFDTAFPAYRAQLRSAEMGDACHQALAAADYESFLRAHQRGIIAAKNIPKDWPPELQEHLDTPLTQLSDGASCLVGALRFRPDMAKLRLGQLLEDYYFIRSGGEETIRALPEGRIAFYRHLGTAAHASGKTNQPFARMAVLLAALL